MKPTAICPRCRGEYAEGTEWCPRDGAALCDQEDLNRLGLCFDSYELTEILGVGGMGVVYRGRHTVLDKPVAVKILNQHYGKRRSAEAEMLREAQAASRIRNPHIVDVSDFGQTDDGAAFLVMEYLEGRSLASVLRRLGRLPVTTAIAVALQMARGLAAAHLSGIIHRDLKPENIFLVELDPAGPDVAMADKAPTPEKVFVKLLDFGLAKIIDMGPSDRTRAGMLAGTPHYMSPEQAQNRPVDGRSDIYSLGVLLYQMVTGVMPFDGASTVDILVAHIQQPIRHPRQHAPWLDSVTAALICRCLEKEPPRRYQTMEAVADALAECASSAWRSTEPTVDPARPRVAPAGPTVSATPWTEARPIPATEPSASSEAEAEAEAEARPSTASLDRGNPTLSADILAQVVPRPQVASRQIGDGPPESGGTVAQLTVARSRSGSYAADADVTQKVAKSSVTGGFAAIRRRPGVVLATAAAVTTLLLGALWLLGDDRPSGPRHTASAESDGAHVAISQTSAEADNATDKARPPGAVDAAAHATAAPPERVEDLPASPAAVEQGANRTTKQQRADRAPQHRRARRATRAARPRGRNARTDRSASPKPPAEGPAAAAARAGGAGTAAMAAADAGAPGESSPSRTGAREAKSETRAPASPKRTPPASTDKKKSQPNRKPQRQKSKHQYKDWVLDPVIE